MALRAILYAWLLSGTLDITAALILFGSKGGKPERLLQGIASGLLGPGAFQGGFPTAMLGLALHFLIAFTATIVYYLASRGLTALVARPFLFGPLYGVAVYIVMNYVVLPLSAVAKRPFSASATITNVIILMLCIGLPIAVVLGRQTAK